MLLNGIFDENLILVYIKLITVFKNEFKHFCKQNLKMLEILNTK
jgi:hypothetical protein